MSEVEIKRKSEGKPMSEADLREWQKGWEEINEISSKLKDVRK